MEDVIKMFKKYCSDDYDITEDFTYTELETEIKRAVRKKNIKINLNLFYELIEFASEIEYDRNEDEHLNKSWEKAINNYLKKLPKLPKPNKEGKIGIEWLQVEEDIYLTAKDQFYGVYGYGNDKDWNDGKMSWVFWYVCDEVENLINKLKQQTKKYD